MKNVTMRLRNDKDLGKASAILGIFGIKIRSAEPVPDDPGVEYTNILGVDAALMNTCPNCTYQFQGRKCPRCGAEL